MQDSVRQGGLPHIYFSQQDTIIAIHKFAKCKISAENNNKKLEMTELQLIFSMMHSNIAHNQVNVLTLSIYL